MQNPIIDESGDESGARRWVDEDGLAHREDGPAIVTPTRYAWCRHGRLHRDDGPAYIRSDGSVEYWQHGQRHREDGPAVVRPSGLQEWFLHGQRHREGGPAVIWPNGEKEYWVDGRKVRYDDLIDIDLDWAILAKGAFNEGVAAQRRAEREFERTGVFAKPINPYVPIALRLVRERNEQRPRRH